MKTKNTNTNNTYTDNTDRPYQGGLGDGIDRRDFLNCMAWAGTGLLWTFSGGVPTSRLLADTHSAAKESSFRFLNLHS